MSMILRSPPTCVYCARELARRNLRPSGICMQICNGIRCGRCNHLLGRVVELQVPDTQSDLIQLLVERNMFEIEEFGIRNGPAFVELTSRIAHVRVRFDWRPLEPEEYEVSNEDQSLAGKVERLRVQLEQKQLDELPEYPRSCIETILLRDLVPIQASIAPDQGQMRFRDLYSLTGGMGQHLCGLVRVQLNWQLGARAMVRDEDTQQRFVSRAQAA
jgi:hypothetical protein